MGWLAPLFEVIGLLVIVLAIALMIAMWVTDTDL